MVKMRSLTILSTFLTVSLLVLLMTNVSGCRPNSKNCPDGSHDVIYIENSSGVAISWRRAEYSGDTIWKLNGSTYPDITDRRILAGDTYYHHPGLQKCWEYYFSGEGSQYYFLFSFDTVQAIGWKQIDGTNRGLLKKVKVDLEYLKHNNFTITYP